MEQFPPTATQFSDRQDKYHNDDLDYSHGNQNINNPDLIIDSTSSKFGISLFASFITVIITAFIICVFLPPAYQVIKKSQGKCLNPTRISQNGTIQCTDFDVKDNPKRGILVKGLNQDNQYLITNSNFYLVDPEVQTVLKGDIILDQYQTNEKDDDDKVQNQIASTQTNYQINPISKQNKIYSDKQTLLGLQHQLFYQHRIVSANQLFIIDFVNISSQPNIKNVQLEVLVINSSFTKFSIALRIVFFVLSLLSCLLYTMRYKYIEQKCKVLEHKLIYLLSILLVFFNNPLIILAFKGQNKFLVFFTQLTTILLPVFLVFFWICTFERGDIQNTIHKSNVLQKPFKWILLITLLTFQLSVYLFKAYHHLLDYMGNPNEDPKPLVVLDYIAFSIAIICLLFMLIRAINIFKNTETMSRYRVLVGISIFFIVFQAIFLFSQSFYIFSIKPKQIFLVVIFMNAYVFYLQALYQPIKYAIIDPLSSKEIQIPASATSSTLRQKTYPYPNLNMPKLSTIVQRSVEQSAVGGRFVIQDNVDFSTKNDNLDNFQIGQPQQPASIFKSIPKVTQSKINVIQEQNQDQDGPSDDINSDKNVESDLIQNSKQFD